MIYINKNLYLFLSVLVCLKAWMVAGVGLGVVVEMGGGRISEVQKWLNNIVLNSPEGKYELLSMALIIF